MPEVLTTGTSSLSSTRVRTWVLVSSKAPTRPQAPFSVTSSTAALAAAPQAWASSRKSASKGRPSKPPAALASSIASSTPWRKRSPSSRSSPSKGISTPMATDSSPAGGGSSRPGPRKVGGVSKNRA